MSDLPTDEARRARADAHWTDDERTQMANCIEHIATDQRYSTEAVGMWVRNNLRELLASLRDKTAGGAEGWRPANTAPTNVAVQVYCPGLDYYGNQGVYAGMLVDMGTGQRWMTFAWAMGRDMIGENRPTHWRPLPAPLETPDEAAHRTQDQNRGGEDG